VTPRTRSTRLAAAAAVLAVLGGCSLSDDPPGGQPPPSGSPTDAPSDDAGATGGSAEVPAVSTPGPDATGTSAPPAAGGRAAADVDLAALTVSWPCGYAFELSDPDGSATLVLEWVTPEASLPTTVIFPDPRWEGRLLLGENLSGVTCTPGTEPAGLEETWEVIAGNIRFTDQGGSVPDGPVRAQLAGVLVDAPDGSRLELPNQEVVNPGWGVTYDE
jgi:hypothetical protein